MSKLLTAVLAAVFAVVTVSPVAFAQEKKEETKTKTEAKKKAEPKKAETEKNLFRPRFDAEPPMPIPLVAALSVAGDDLSVFRALRVEIRHPMLEERNLDAQSEDRGERRQRFLAKGLPRVHQAVLREVPDRRLPGHGDRALVGLLRPGHEAQERRFPRAVRAGEPDPIPDRDVPGDVLEQGSPRELLGKVLYLKHVRQQKARPSRAGFHHNIIACFHDFCGVS